MSQKSELGTLAPPIVQWAVLRCQSALTIKLEEDLVEFGLLAWTPKFTVLARLPHKRRPRPVDRLALPSFVFLHDHQCHDAHLMMSRRDTPKFKPFYSQGVLVRIADPLLEGLRAVEAMPLAPEGPALWPGCHVMINDGPLAGMVAEVEAVRGRSYAIIRLITGLRVKIATFLLDVFQARGPDIRVI